MSEIAFDPEFMEVIVIDDLNGIVLVTGKIDDKGDYLDTVSTMAE